MPLSRTHTHVEKAELLGAGPAAGPRVLGHAARTWLCLSAHPAPQGRAVCAAELWSDRPPPATPTLSPAARPPLGRSSRRQRREAAGESSEPPSLPDAPLRASPSPASPACDPPSPLRTGEPPPLRPRDTPADGGRTASLRYPQAQRGVGGESDRGAAGEASAWKRVQLHACLRSEYSAA